jgi:hypothetical protein
MGYRLDSRGWIPGRGKMFLFSTTSRVEQLHKVALLDSRMESDMVKLKEKMGQNINQTLLE